MRIQNLIICLIAVASATSLRADFLSRLFPIDFQVVTNTDVLDPSATAPQPGKPIYYLAVAAGYRELGRSVAGEKVPHSKEVIDNMTKVLAAQGFKLASNKNAPSILIAYSWGTLNPERSVRAFEPSGQPFWATNRAQSLDFMGAYKLGMGAPSRDRAFPELSPGLTHLSSEGTALDEISDEGLYVLSLAAYDFDAAQKGNAKVLWKTHISTPSHGHYLPEVIPTMLAVAAPFIGRDTARPVRVDVGATFRPNVEIGPLKEVQ